MGGAKTPETKAYYVIDELAERWRVSRSTIQRQVSKGMLRQVKVGASVRFSADEVARYERAMSEGAERSD